MDVTAEAKVMHKRLMTGLMIYGWLLWAPWPIAAQFLPEPLNLERSASQTQLQVGQETDIQIRVQAQDASLCTQTHSQPADVVLVIDVSSSMSSDNKMTAAQEAATQFIEAMDVTTDRVAVIAFHSFATTELSLTQDKVAARQAVAALRIQDMTDIAAALREAGNVLQERRAEATANIVLLSDGGSDYNPAVEAAQVLRNKGFDIFSISLGKNADQVLMKDLASAAGGHWHAPSAYDLTQIYADIQKRIEASGIKNVEVTVTYDDNYLSLLPLSVTPNATVNDAALTWQLPLVTNEVQTLHFRVQAIQTGNFPASPSAQLRYLCGEEPRGVDLGPAVDLVVLLPPTPTPLPYCELDPLGNDCITTVACLGPLSLPCAGLGMPWWVCFLLLLLLLSATLLWWLWQQLENRRRHTTVSQKGAITSPASNLMPWTPLTSSPTPVPLQPLERTRNVRVPLRTLVIGLGGTGEGVIQSLEQTLQEAYGQMPATIRCLALDIEPKVNGLHTYHIPVNQSVSRLIERATTPHTDIPEVGAWLPANTSLDTRVYATGRPLRRLALFADLTAVKARLSTELRALLREAGDDVTIYVVGALAGMTGSALLVDIAHWLRLRAQTENAPGIAIHALLLLPEAHTAGMPLEIQSPVWQTAAAAWRELNRFQLVFEPPYPLQYLNDRTVRESKLFERVYLLGPERQDGPSLMVAPLQAGLYPAIADIIVGLADPATRPVWEERARAMDSRLNNQQRQRWEPLYSSLGSFTYVLPIEDLLERQALHFMLDWVKAMRTSKGDKHESALTFLAQSVSATGISSTSLIRSVADFIRQEHSNAIAQAESYGLALLEWLGPFTEDADQKFSRESIHELAISDMCRRVLTSDVARAPDYAADTQRVLKQAAEVVAQLSQIQPWLNGCQEVQQCILKRLLDEQLAPMLCFAPQRAERTGPAAALDFLKNLQDCLKHYHTIVQAARVSYEPEARVARAHAQEQREALEAMTCQRVEGHPTYGRAALSGLVPAVGATLLFGALTLAMPAWSLPLGGLAAVGSGVGIWLSHRKLFGKSAFVQQQRTYLEAEQAHMEAEVTLALYTAWECIAEAWVTLVSQTLQPLQAWDQCLAMLLDARLPEIHQEVAARRAQRDAIQVRKYLDDDPLEKALYQRFFDPAVLTEARTRVNWRLQAEGVWLPDVAGTAVYTLSSVTLEAVEQALFNVARSYASRVRMLNIADVLTEWYAAPTVAEEAGLGSAPLIRIYPNLQPESEAHRLMSVQTQKQPVYFDDILRQLRKPAAQSHTEQLTASSHAHRCAVLASLDVLRLAGLPAWEHGREFYSHTSGEVRAALHVFPAEVNAAHWETQSGNVGLQGVILSPTTSLTLENSRRALAFWRALACGWIQDREASRRGITSLWTLALELPGAAPVWLTEPDENTPSLWRAAATFALTPARDAITAAIGEAWNAFLHPARPQDKRAVARVLEATLDRANELRAASDPREAKLHILLRLAAEDGLRRLEGGALLFNPSENDIR